jgi:methane monooxygenase PmoA-like
MRFSTRAGLVAAITTIPALAPAIAALVQVIPHPVAPRVDVVVRGEPFASYLYLTSMPRPALFPILAPGGGTITAGTGDDPLSAARAGFWFAHGDVNGIDFSRGDGAAPRNRIAHRRVVEAVSSDTHGQLTVQTAWTAADGSILLVEDTSLTFRESDGGRIVDRVTRLGAVNGPVRLGGTALAQVGLQLAGGFRGADAIAGRPDGGTGPAVASGVRATWLAVPGSIDGQAVTVALFDHAHNPGHPNWLRINGGNNLELAPAGEVAIAAQESVTFRYRLAVTPRLLNPAELDALHRDFIR